MESRPGIRLQKAYQEEGTQPEGLVGLSSSIELYFENLDPDLIKQVGSAIPASQFKLSRDEVADTLEKAADLYQAEQVEWCTKEWIQRPQGVLGKVSVCAGGAIALAAGLNLNLFYRTYGQAYTDGAELARDPNYGKFREVLDRVAMHLGEPVPSWNDNLFTPRTKADVIDMLRRAAKDIRDDIDKES